MSFLDSPPWKDPTWSSGKLSFRRRSKRYLVWDLSLVKVSRFINWDENPRAVWIGAMEWKWQVSMPSLCLMIASSNLFAEKSLVFQMVEGFCFNKSQKTSYAQNTWWQLIHDSWKLQKNSHANSCFEGHFKKGSAQARWECTEETKGSVRTTIWHYMTLYDTMWLYESTANLYLHGP